MFQDHAESVRDLEGKPLPMSGLDFPLQLGIDRFVGHVRPAGVLGGFDVSGK